MEGFEILEAPVVEDIKLFIKEQKENRNISSLYPNVILRGDVLQILDAECKVVYYPMENENNHGFHISDMIDRNGNTFNFVYINTHQTLATQIFTAAHELGHAWKIEDYIAAKHRKRYDEQYKERIVNRFAAELLMPQAEFHEKYMQVVRRYMKEDNKLLFKDFLRLVASLMYFFLVPMKAVLVRMAETGFISVDTVNKFIGDKPGDFTDIIKSSMEQVIKEEGYTELLRTTDKKMIDGLAELLETAEAQQSVSPEKIKNMRNRFEIEADKTGKLSTQEIILEGDRCHDSFD